MIPGQYPIGQADSDLREIAAAAEGKRSARDIRNLVGSFKVEVPEDVARATEQLDQYHTDGVAPLVDYVKARTTVGSFLTDLQTRPGLSNDPRDALNRAWAYTSFTRILEGYADKRTQLEEAEEEWPEEFLNKHVVDASVAEKIQRGEQ